MYSVFWVSRYVITDYYYYYLKKNQNAPRPSEYPPVIIVRYCSLWLLCGRERFAQYCFLWRSCADVRCLNWAGSISFESTFLRGYLWASPFFFFFFFFLSTLGIELTFSLYKNIYSQNLARFARGFLIHATGLSRESIL